jgi:hypothetical protein
VRHASMRPPCARLMKMPVNNATESANAIAA